MQPAPVAATCRTNLRLIVAAYRQATGSSLSAVSKAFYGNAGFLDSFLKGTQSMSIDKYETVVTNLRTKWPENAAWPFLRAIVIPQPVIPRRKKISPEK